MNEQTARLLTHLTSEFYTTVQESFSATRATPWPGWERVLARARPSLSSPARVVDLACGNLRFECYLARELAPASHTPGATCAEVYALDSCDELVGTTSPEGIALSYTHLDVVQTLLAQQRLHLLPPHIPGCDLAVCFGFMHHLAMPEHRLQVLQALVQSVRPQGLVAISFWQLSHSPRLLAKAQAITRDAAARLGLEGLGQGDYLLGWQRRSDVLRYCHDFSDAELDHLVQELQPQARQLVRFSADGASGDLNRYVILQRSS